MKSQLRAIAIKRDKKRFTKLVARRLPKLAAVILLTSSLVWIVAGQDKPAYGCSCAPPESALVERDRAAAVFVGTVSRITPTSLFVRGEGEHGPVAAKDIEFNVSEQWKENIVKTIRIKTMAYGASCGYSFEIGETYLVYARLGSYPFWDESELVVGSCSRTSLRANADADVAELNGESFSAPAEDSKESETGCGYSSQ